MTLHITDRATDRLMRLLAQKKGRSIEETVREAVRHQIERERKKMPSERRLRSIQNRLRAELPARRRARNLIGRFPVIELS